MVHNVNQSQWPHWSFPPANLLLMLRHNLAKIQSDWIRVFGINWHQSVSFSSQTVTVSMSQYDMFWTSLHLVWFYLEIVKIDMQQQQLWWKPLVAWKQLCLKTATSFTQTRCSFDPSQSDAIFIQPIQYNLICCNFDFQDVVDDVCDNDADMGRSQLLPKFLMQNIFWAAHITFDSCISACHMMMKQHMTKIKRWHWECHEAACSNVLHVKHAFG